MVKVIAVFAGGGLGCAARYGLGLLFKKMGQAGVFPWATLTANILACLVLGMVVYLFREKLSSGSFLLLTTGFCGGLSTFSAFSLETVELINKGFYGLAVFNVLGSVLVCLGLILLISKMQ